MGRPISQAFPRIGLFPRSGTALCYDITSTPGRRGQAFSTLSGTPPSEPRCLDESDLGTGDLESWAVQLLISMAGGAP